MNKKKILLIEPPFYRLYKDSYSIGRFPLSLGYLSASIKERTDWEVAVYNADFSPNAEVADVSYLTGEGFTNYKHNIKSLDSKIWHEISDVVQKYDPDVVGISAKSQNFASVCNVAQIVKGINSNIQVLIGGPHPTLVGKSVLRSEYIDYAVKGEGEETIVELLLALGSNDCDKTCDVKGVMFKCDGMVCENGDRPLIEELDSLQFPHSIASEVLLDYELYPKSAFKNIFAIRGCPFACLFCGSRGVWSRRVRYRSPKNVAREIRSLQNMGLMSVHFDDDTFGVSKDHIRELCKEIERSCSGIKWSCELHVKLADNDTLSMMKRAGCYSIQLGVESGCNEILKAMKKQITIEEAFEACDHIKKHGLELQVFFMVGFPQETEVSLRKTFDAMKKVHCDAVLYSIFTPYPGTDLFRECTEMGLIPNDYDISMHNHQSPLNAFCQNISKKKFREVVSEIEAFVDKRNSSRKINRILSRNTLWRIREMGYKKSLSKAVNLLLRH